MCNVCVPTGISACFFNAEDNILIFFVYQVPDVNSEWMFWIIPNGKYRIVNKHVFNNSQDIILTLGTTALVANIVAKGVTMKEKPNPISHDAKFFILMAKSSFIDFCDSINKDGPSFPDVVVHVFPNSQPTKEQPLHLVVKANYDVDNFRENWDYI